MGSEPSVGPSSDERPDRFFAQMLDAFEDATATVGVDPVHLTIADRSVTLQFAGDRLPDLVASALRHQKVATSEQAGFSINLFDTVSTGVSPPPPPWGPDDYRAQGAIAGFNTGRFRTAFRVEAGSLSMVDLERRVGVFWIHDPAMYPRWMQAAPLRTLLGWWAAGEGLQMAHGAAIGTAEAGVLITARGGSGKSTSALRCLQDGLRYAGDDYVLVDPATRMVHSVYCTAKADDAAIDRFFPDLRDHSHGRIIGDDSNKHVFYLDELYADQLGDVPLTGLAVPSLTEAESSGFSGIAPAAALRALAPTTLFQLAGAGSDEFRVMAELVKEVPIFRLEVSAADSISDTVRQLLGAAEAVPA